MQGQTINLSCIPIKICYVSVLYNSLTLSTPCYIDQLYMKGGQKERIRHTKAPNLQPNLSQIKRISYLKIGEMPYVAGD